MRKAIETSADLCRGEELSDWRQSVYNVRCLKKAYRQVQTLKRSRAIDEANQAARAEEIAQAYRDYLAPAESFLERARLTRLKLTHGCQLPEPMLAPLDAIIAHSARQIDQIERRVFGGERIPHAEKVFSIFEPHTEWISKGKAGVAVELGLRVVIGEDQHRFILHHRVMEKQTDDQVAVPMLEDLKARFPDIASASFDKGFHSPANQKRVAEIVDFPVSPKKSKLSRAQRAHEQDPRFGRLRWRHSGV